MKDVEELFVSDLEEYGDNFIDIILNMGIVNEFSLPIEELRYNTLFDESNVKLVHDIKKDIQSYCDEYNKLIKESEIFNEDFAHNNAININDNLESNGFFKANHILKLNNGCIIENEEIFKKVIQEEKNRILKNMESKFDDVDNHLDKSKKNLRYLIRKYPDIILQGYLNLPNFKKELWFSILNYNKSLFDDLIEVCNKNKQELNKISKEANKEKSQ